jgi:hypothetical protein
MAPYPSMPVLKTISPAGCSLRGPPFSAAARGAGAPKLRPRNTDPSSKQRKHGSFILFFVHFYKAATQGGILIRVTITLM